MITEEIICEVLIGDTQKNALEFASFLRAGGMQLERIHGYWEDKYYWGAKYNDSYICFILISTENKTDRESWTIWSDDRGSDIIGDGSLDERTKEVLWRHINYCGKCGGCRFGTGTLRVIYGKKFDNVCLTAMKFETPDTETLECIRKMVEARKRDIRFSLPILSTE